jgi:hypothetical protein
MLRLFALGIVLVEVCLRAQAVCSGEAPALANALQACRLVPGHNYGAGLRGNRLGYPGPEFQRERQPGIARIAALGNSFAVGPIVPFADNYLTLLQRDRPATEVYNFGVSGAGPREYALILRREVLAFQPDLVLVSLFVTHDVTELLPTPRHLDPRQHSLYWLFARNRGPAQPCWEETPPDAGPVARLLPDTLTPSAFRVVEAQRLAVCRIPDVPGLEKKWRRTLHDLRRLVEDCRTHQILVAFVLIPDEAQVDPDVLDDLFQSGVLDPRTFDRDRPQRRLREFCTAAGVPCLDLLPVFQGRTDLYAPRNTHWNVTGNRLAARVLADWLAAGPLSLPPAARPRPAP